MIFSLIIMSTTANTIIEATIRSMVVRGKPPTLSSPGAASGIIVISFWLSPSLYPFFVAVVLMLTLNCVVVCGAVKVNAALPFESVSWLVVEKSPPPSDNIVTFASVTGFVLYVT